MMFSVYILERCKLGARVRLYLNSKCVEGIYSGFFYNSVVINKSGSVVYIHPHMISAVQVMSPRKKKRRI
ncbi:hypothetical protein PIL02S_01971 [Paenibacillus illinoisensis]|uniref:Uncharacterized protein n=1 Tax=Paenibacillus illinoisensis TaxID=59845 RepID=A0A2W0D1F4_9BACL|nr:hypothetical protein PIL02S_01971 [Paenibacillus illinoisensis]